MRERSDDLLLFFILRGSTFFKKKMNPNQESEAEDDLPQQNVPNLQLQAIMGQIERLLTHALEPIQEKLDEVDARTCNR